MTFNTAISAGVLTLSMNGGSSQLLASQQPSTMSVSGNELRINPRVPPGAGSGTVIPVSIQIKLTESGTLELWCVSRRDGSRWKLEFNVREKA